MSPPARTDRQERHRIKFELRRALFVLPNLFTLGSIFCGFYAITLCLEPRTSGGLYPAAIAIFVGMWLDLFDGRVARLTKTQSEFGRQLDSLADLVSFGTAPAILLYAWALRALGPVGLSVAFGYVACGAMRLARFNVLSTQSRTTTPARIGAPDMSVGLPIPPAAGAVVALVMTVHPYRPSGWLEAVPVAGGVLLLGLLMVSNVHFRTFKDLAWSPRVAAVVLGAGTIFGGIAVLIKPAAGLAAVFATYIAWALTEEVGGRLSARRRAGSTSSASESRSDTASEVRRKPGLV